MGTNDAASSAAGQRPKAAPDDLAHPGRVTRLVAQLEQSLDRHGWKRCEDEDPEETAATAAVLAGVPVGTAVTVPSHRRDNLTVAWTTSLRHVSVTTGGHNARTGRHEARPAGMATRREGASSATSSSDPPPDGESEPAPRRCVAPWCDHLVYGPPQKIYCGTERCDQARAAERQRQSRLHSSVDLVELERREALEHARLAGYVGGQAFAAPRDPARRMSPDGRSCSGHLLSFLWTHGIVTDGDDPGEFAALTDTSLRTCRCNGHHIDGGVVGCFRCGMPREAVPV